MLSACCHGVRCFRPDWFEPCPLAAEKTDLLNLNTVTVEQLKALPGMGIAYAEKIIEGRPYQRKEELVQRKILSRPAYEGSSTRLWRRRSEPEQSLNRLAWLGRIIKMRQGCLGRVERTGD